MIKIWKQNDVSIVQSAILERGSWLQVIDPTPLEIASLEREYGVYPVEIKDILDVVERSRSVREADHSLIIYRVPTHSAHARVQYHTIPIGIILVEGLTITISAGEPEFLKKIQGNPIRGFSLANQVSFVLHLFQQAAAMYLRYLKEINRKSSEVERDLQRSIRNNELVNLLDMEKSLVFFTTSLKSNELLIDKLRKTWWKALDETEVDLLEDVITENRQAIEMANIYSNILSGMMDAFASVISNNLNTVMKRLTMISIALMIPTLFASLYGMNLSHLPFSRSPLAFLGIVVVSVLASILGALFFAKSGRFK